MRISDALRTADRRFWAALGLLVLAVGVHLVRPAGVGASGHSPYSYKAGKNCKGTSNITDPVSVQFLTHTTVSGISQLIESQSAVRRAENHAIPIWTSGNALDDVKGQQGSYYRGSTRVCSSFSETNATGGALTSRYHLRLHTGGPSSSAVGYNVVAGTPHYDKRCGTKHEIWTFAGARTQLAKVFPKTAYPGQWIKYIGNTHVRHFNCLNKDTASDGYTLFIFAE